MDSQAYSWLILAMIGTVLLTPVIMQLLRGRLDPFNPLVVVLATYFLYFGVAPALDLATANTSFLGLELRGLLPKSLTYALIGFMALLVGYYARFGKTVAAHLPKPARRVNLLHWGLAVYLTGLLGYGALLSRTGMSWVMVLTLGQLGQRSPAEWTPSSAPLYYYLYMSMNLMTPGVIMLWASKRVHRWLLWILSGVPLLTYIAAGFRYRVVVLMLALITLRYFRLGKRPRLSLVAAIIVVGVLIVGGIGAVRKDIRAGNTIEWPSFADVWREFSYSIALYQPFAILVDRLSGSGQYYWGSSYVYVFLQPIPRAIWRSKPEAPIHVILRDITGSDEAVRMGIAYPQIGELYANFGLPGIIIGMLFFGVCLRVLEQYYRLYRFQPSVQALMSVAVPYLIQVVSRGYFVQIATEVSFLLLPFLIVIWAPRPLRGVPLTGRVSRYQTGGRT